MRPGEGTEGIACSHSLPQRLGRLQCSGTTRDEPASQRANHDGHVQRKHDRPGRQAGRQRQHGGRH